jgi:hypothetical protein
MNEKVGLGLIWIVAILVLVALCNRPNEGACHPVYDDGDRGTYTIPEHCKD